MSKELFALIAVNAVVVPDKSGPAEVAPGNPFTVDSEEERDRLVSLGAATVGPVAAAKPAAKTAAKAETGPAKKSAAAAPAEDDAAKAAAAAAGGPGAGAGGSEDLV
jgi:hypothetical protein